VTSTDYTPVIPKADLVDGQYYEGESRNASVARWDAVQGCFLYWVYDFGSRYLDSISCPEDDSVHDVFVAHRVQIAPTQEIPLDPRSVLVPRQPVSSKS
jgi:hypothetical protein